MFLFPSSRWTCACGEGFLGRPRIAHHTTSIQEGVYIDCAIASPTCLRPLAAEHGAAFVWLLIVPGLRRFSLFFFSSFPGACLERMRTGFGGWGGTGSVCREKEGRGEEGSGDGNLMHGRPDWKAMA